jgi:hypothetical protein
MRRINDAGGAAVSRMPVPLGIGGIDVKEFSLAGNEYK